MKFKRFLFILIITLTTIGISQAGAPPTVMFLPDRTWCTKNNFVDIKERNGKKRYTERYDDAFNMDSDLKNVIVQLNALLGDNGINAKDYTTANELDDEEEDEEEFYDDNGEELALTPYEQALNKLRPDIIIRLGWDENKVGFNRSVSYRLEAVDSYSGKSIAQVTGETASQKITIPLAAVLKNAAAEHMPQFLARLQSHFDDIQANGREVTLSLRIGQNSDIDFDTMIDGKELSTIISDWVNDNTVNNVYSTSSSSSNRIQFEQMRIPFKDANGREMRAKEFTDQLKRYLTKYQIYSKNATKGLGSGRLYNIKND